MDPGAPHDSTNMNDSPRQSIPPHLDDAERLGGGPPGGPERRRRDFEQQSTQNETLTAKEQAVVDLMASSNHPYRDSSSTRPLGRPFQEQTSHSSRAITSQQRSLEARLAQDRPLAQLRLMSAWQADLQRVLPGQEQRMALEQPRSSGALPSQQHQSDIQRGPPGQDQRMPLGQPGYLRAPPSEPRSPEARLGQDLGVPLAQLPDRLMSAWQADLQRVLPGQEQTPSQSGLSRAPLGQDQQGLTTQTSRLGGDVIPTTEQHRPQITQQDWSQAPLAPLPAARYGVSAQGPPFLHRVLPPLPTNEPAERNPERGVTGDFFLAAATPFPMKKPKKWFEQQFPRR